MPPELLNWLFTQGPFAGIAGLLIWDRMALKAEIKAERDRNSELQESRLVESKALVEIVQSNRTAMQALTTALGKGS